MPPFHVVISPDSFKGSAAAHVAAAAIARGWRSVRPDDELRLLPMADGGEGTVDAFASAYPSGELKSVSVTGPVGEAVDTEWLLLPDGTGVVELASASGITLLDPLQAFDAQTIGFGQVIAAALDGGATGLLLGIGGSSSTDGGAGALSALGALFLDEQGEPVPSGNVGLGRIQVADLAELRPVPPQGAIVLSDVTNPLLGENGAAAVFGPQKGASEADIPLLDANLAHYAGLFGADAPVDVQGAGAAGGTGFGLLAWGASIQAGSGAVGEALGMQEAVAAADIVITGEGRFDSQSAQGKVPSYLLGLATAADARAFLVAGLIEAPTTGFAAAVSLTDLAGSGESARSGAEGWLEVAGAYLAAQV